MRWLNCIDLIRYGLGFVFLCSFGVGMLGCEPEAAKSDLQRCKDHNDCADPRAERCIQNLCMPLRACSTDADCSAQVPTCLRSQQGGEGYCIKKENVGCTGGQEGKPCTVANAKGICAEGLWVCRESALSCIAKDSAKPSEICGNNLDDNCDGQVDEGCACTPGQSEPCYTGAAATRDVGTCKAGTRSCSQDGNWGACIGEVLPAANELCGNGLDDNCNGQVDENCGCKAGSSESCYEGAEGTRDKGICRSGTRYCNPQGQWEKCTDQILPFGQESCNGRDDNCDGLVDNNPTGGQLGNSCKDSTKKGICQEGKFVCKNGQEVCEGNDNARTVETCNGMDDDCDGFIDNATTGLPAPLTRSCYTGPAGTRGVGLCRSGEEICSNGVWSTQCAGEVVPQPRNPASALDHDCDGQPDNGAATPQGCADGTVEQNESAWGGNMVGCDCANPPCAVDEAKDLCAAGWQPCQQSEWLARWNGKLSNKRRYVRGRLTCPLPPPVISACNYPPNQGNSFADDPSSPGFCARATNCNNNAHLRLLVGDNYVHPNVCPGGTVPNSTLPAGNGNLSHGGLLVSFADYQSTPVCMAYKGDNVAGVMCCR